MPVSMDWVRSFYEKQHQWAGVCSGPVEDVHRRRARLIVCPGRKPPYRILELGCGGGQSAVALAELGHEVVGIDLLPAAIQHARALGARTPGVSVAWVEADFYHFDPLGDFDVVCSFDGFGVGTDADQRRLLKRVASWLRPTGCAFIDIYNPSYWEQQAGKAMSWRDVSRRYDYDREGSRMLDTWWPAGHPELAVTQSLRCYAPEELRSLIDGTGLSLVKALLCAEFPEEAKVAATAMQYRARLRHL